MNLDTYFQLSVSVFCTLASIAIVVSFVWAILLRSQINRLIKKLLEISEIARETAGDSKLFIKQTIEQLEKFKQSIFTFEFARRVITEVIGLIQSRPKRSKNKK